MRVTFGAVEFKPIKVRVHGYGLVVDVTCDRDNVLQPEDVYAAFAAAGSQEAAKALARLRSKAEAEERSADMAGGW